MKQAWRMLFALAVARALAMLHRGQAIGWDELEFFRATKWIGEGLVPYRDFWEHHLPLQWIVFAPIASLFGGGPGTASIVVMRWAQLAMWMAIFVIVLRLSSAPSSQALPFLSSRAQSGEGRDDIGEGRDDMAIGSRWLAFIFLLASTTFVRPAIEYRVDVLGNLLFLVAVLFIAENRQRWTTCGVLLAAAVLANMRLAPMAVAVTIYALWRYRLPATRMFLGALAVVAIFTASLSATHAWPGFIDGLYRYNSTSARLQDIHNFSDALLTPVWTLDIAGVALWLFAIAGCYFAREHFVTVVFVASIVTIALMDVQYDYHFQLTFLLMVPLASNTFGKLADKWKPLTAIVAGAAIVIAILQAAPRFGDAMRYQNAVMRAADRFTSPHEPVLDGAGYALRRKPAYRYWFLATGVRMMAASGLLPRYDFAKNPPGAVIVDYRMQLYLTQFPQLAREVVQHSVPLYRNLWIPGCSAAGAHVVCVATKAGTYDVVASDLLLRHPWFQQPLEFAGLPGDYSIPLARLPRTNVRVRVDGVPASGTLTLRKGSRVEIDAASKTGVLVVPHVVGTLATGPEDELFVF